MERPILLQLEERDVDLFEKILGLMECDGRLTEAEEERAMRWHEEIQRVSLEIDNEG